MPEQRLFSVPLTIESKFVGRAIVDTGGAFEVLLRDSFGLAVVGKIDVLAFGGREWLDVTQGFGYCAGGVAASAPFAIVGLATCTCNGVGYLFFRNHGVVLGLDFPRKEAFFVSSLPATRLLLPFASPPEGLESFESVFIPVSLHPGLDLPTSDRSQTVVAVLDTGATTTVIRRGILDITPSPVTGLVEFTVDHEELGTLAVRGGEFTTPGLPDLIIGLDAMRAWGDYWYFAFTPHGGAVAIDFKDGHAAHVLPTDRRVDDACKDNVVASARRFVHQLPIEKPARFDEVQSADPSEYSRLMAVTPP